MLARVSLRWVPALLLFAMGVRASAQGNLATLEGTPSDFTYRAPLSPVFTRAVRVGGGDSVSVTYGAMGSNAPATIPLTSSKVPVLPDTGPAYAFFQGKIPADSTGLLPSDGNMDGFVGAPTLLIAYSVGGTPSSAMPEVQLAQAVKTLTSIDGTTVYFFAPQRNKLNGKFLDRFPRIDVDLGSNERPSD